MGLAVVFMTGWNAYIALRLRPDLPTVVINLAFWWVPTLVVLAVSGRLWRSLALGAALTFVLQRLHWLKWRYLEHTWTAADFRFAADRDNWVVLRQYPEILAFAVVCGSLVVLAWLLMPRGPRVAWKTRAASALVAASLVGGVFHWHAAHTFDPFGFNVYGHFANLVFSASTLTYHPPVTEGSSATFLARAAALPLESATGTGSPPSVPAAPATPDLVVWLQESAMDLRLLDLPGARLPALAMYTPDADTRAHGRLRVPSWGGSTWLSEFALLTGLSHEDFGPSGNGVYYSVTPHVQYPLPTLLKQHGYRSVALSGSPKAFYNMETGQRDLGFDEVLNPLDFPEWGGKSLATHAISDEELARYALAILSRPREQPLLLFVLSIMQHGPYDAGHPITHGLGRAGLDRSNAARLSDYVARMTATSTANVAFGAQVLSGPRPVVFAYFGDHQPNLGGPVPYLTGVANARYVTSYAIKSNFPVPASATQATPLDISFLGGLILQHAGLPLGPLFGANQAMRRLCDGALTDCPDLTLTNSYRSHLYRDLQAARSPVPHP